MKLWFGAVAALAAAMLGLGINVLLHQWFSFLNWGELTLLTDWSLAGLEKAFNKIIPTFGWRSNVNLFSESILCNLGAMVILILFVVAVCDILRHQDRYRIELVNLTLFVLAGIIIFVGIAVVIETGYDLIVERMIIPITIFVLPIIACYLTQHWHLQIVFGKLKLFVKPLLGAMVFGLILVNAILISSQYYFTDRYSVVGTYTGFSPREDNISLQKITEKLLAADYREGYFYSSSYARNRLTEYSNGEIAVWWTKDINTLAVEQWLQPVARANTVPAGKLFFIFDEYDDEMIRPIFADRTEFYHDQCFTVYMFDDINDLRQVIATRFYLLNCDF